MSQPPHEPPSEPPNEPPAEPPANPPPPLPGQWMPPEHLPPPPGMPPAYGAPIPPPRKSHLGLIIGLVVAGFAVLVGLFVVGLVVYSDDDFDDDASDEETTSSTESEEAEEDEETEATEEPAPEGEVLQGDGYTYELPDGWQDISAAVETQDAAGTIDSASAAGGSLESSPANVIVESGPAGGLTDLESAREQVATNLGAAAGGTPDNIEGRTVGGEETLGLSLTQTNPQGVEAAQVAYVTIVDDTVYVIAFSRAADAESLDEQFDEIVESWSWE